jgi:L-histidine N-alpha-methyltransferase
LPPKYFYDARGSRLFEEITLLPEYYPTRAETAILERHADEFLAAVQPSELVEIGSGSSKKTRLLLEALHAVGGDTYVPLDVSADALEGAVQRLSADFPWLSIHGLVSDFDHGLSLPRASGRRLLCFLGSTIGNFEEDERLSFLRNVRELLDREDGFLLGVDLIKDARVLEAAYDDSRGVTAEFNKNVLRVLNRELDGDFDEDAFRHVAFYDEPRARIEMHLEARRALRVRLSAIELEVAFERLERLRTEISCKFDRPRIERDLAASGLALELWRTDPLGRFALLLARPS